MMNRAWDGLGESLEGSLTIRFMVREFFHLARVKLSEIFIKSVSKDVMNGNVMYPTSLGVKLLAGNVLETHSMVDMGRRLWSLIFCIQVMVPVDVPKLRVVADLRLGKPLQELQLDLIPRKP
ncbi:hypothetical protein MKW98_022557 [Papaver atlanticum]|uniref:Uncharacterized protein n=1 Tax=Papaver atlanticum TaxID=357466 RepID=A0AAD4SKW9_9MAGN|nr:hypothetical protein MKW98_022557 [Papaver atlanticum]